MRTNNTNFENFNCINKYFKAKLIINLESGRNDIYLDAAILSYYKGTIFIVIDSINRVAVSKNNTINSKRDYVKIPEFCNNAIEIINSDKKFKIEVKRIGDLVLVKDKYLDKSFTILVKDRLNFQSSALIGFINCFFNRKD